MRAVPYHQFQQHNPTCPVDWRWRRAEHLVSTGRYASSKRDDGLTCQAVHFIRALNRCTTKRQLAGLAERVPDFHGAHQVRASGGMRRLELEARLLAKQPPEEIARRIGIRPAVIDTYRALFFDIADRIDALDYVVQQAIKQKDAFGRHDEIRAVFVRSVGYFGGPLVLESVLAYFKTAGNRAQRPLDLSTADGRLQRRIELLFAVFELTFMDRAATPKTSAEQGELITLQEAEKSVGNSVKSDAARLEEVCVDFTDDLTQTQLETRVELIELQIC